MSLSSLLYIWINDRLPVQLLTVLPAMELLKRGPDKTLLGPEAQIFRVPIFLIKSKHTVDLQYSIELNLAGIKRNCINLARMDR